MAEKDIARCARMHEAGDMEHIRQRDRKRALGWRGKLRRRPGRTGFGYGRIEQVERELQQAAHGAIQAVVDTAAASDA